MFATANHLQFPFVVREKHNYGMAILYFTLKEMKKLIIKIWVRFKNVFMYIFFYTQALHSRSLSGPEADVQIISN